MKKILIVGLCFLNFARLQSDNGLNLISSGHVAELVKYYESLYNSALNKPDTLKKSDIEIALLKESFSSPLAIAKTKLDIQIQAQQMLLRGIIDDSRDHIKLAVSMYLDSGENLDVLNYNGVPIRITDYGQRSPLAFAIKLARHEAMKTLLDLGFKPVYDDLKYAIQQGDLETGIILLKNNVHIFSSQDLSNINNTLDVNFFSLTFDLIDQAPELGLEFIQALFDNGRKGYGQPSIDKWLKDYESQAWSLLLNRPVFSMMPVVMDLYIKNGLNPNEFGTQGRYNFITPLFMALMTNDIQIVSHLLQIGADVNQKAANPLVGNMKNNNLITPLAFATRGGGNPEIVKLLQTTIKDINLKLALQPKASISDNKVTKELPLTKSDVIQIDEDLSDFIETHEKILHDHQEETEIKDLMAEYHNMRYDWDDTSAENLNSIKLEILDYQSRLQGTIDKLT